MFAAPSGLRRTTRPGAPGNCGRMPSPPRPHVPGLSQATRQHRKAPCHLPQVPGPTASKQSPRSPLSKQSPRSPLSERLLAVSSREGSSPACTCLRPELLTEQRASGSPVASPGKEAVCDCQAKALRAS